MTLCFSKWFLTMPCVGVRLLAGWSAKSIYMCVAFYVPLYTCTIFDVVQSNFQKPLFTLQSRVAMLQNQWKLYITVDVMFWSFYHSVVFLQKAFAITVKKIDVVKFFFVVMCIGTMFCVAFPLYIFIITNDSTFNSFSVFICVTMLIATFRIC